MRATEGGAACCGGIAHRNIGQAQAGVNQLLAVQLRAQVLHRTRVGDALVHVHPVQKRDRVATGHTRHRVLDAGGLPQVLRTDNGPEFLGEIFVQWAKTHAMSIQYIQPGNRNQNAYIEGFNRTFREEVLDQHLWCTGRRGRRRPRVLDRPIVPDDQIARAPLMFVEIVRAVERVE
jgi:transposase InsO family protein